jgi:putative nucleotidyltransferase with HDIG domain
MPEFDHNPGSRTPVGSSSPYLENELVITRELEFIIPVIARVMREQIDALACSFYIYNADQTATVATFRHGNTELILHDLEATDSISPHDVPVEKEVLSALCSIRRSSEDDFTRWPMLNDQLRMSTEGYMDVVVPLLRRDHVYGVVYIWRCGESGAFTDNEIDSIERLAHVAAMAVDFARHYVSERARRRQLNALLTIASLSASHLTVDDVMPEVTRIMRSITEADVCNLYVFDPSGEMVESSFSSGLNQRERWVFDDSDQYPLETVPAEQLARETLSAVVVRDPENELVTNSELVVYAREADISEILIVPIVYQKRMIGVIYLWYRDGTRSFSPEAISTSLGIANQAGGVIQQAKLYDATQQHIVETEALRQIGETVLNSDSLDVVLDQIADVLASMIPHDYALVGIIDHTAEDVVVRRVWGDLPQTLIDYRIDMSSSLMGEAIRTRNILNIPDAFADPRMHRYEPQTLSIRSVLIAPLVTESGPIAVLYLARNESSTFTDRQERLLELLSQHAAVAIERTKARETLSLHAARQTLLANVTSALVAASDPIEALQSICELSCGVLADGVALAVSSWQHGEIRWVGAAHVDPGMNSAFHGSLINGEVEVNPDRVEDMLSAEQSSLMVLEDGIPTDGRELHFTVTDLLSRIDARYLLNVPMRQSGRAAGIMALASSDSTRVFHDELRELAQIVANRIGDALERQQVARNRESLLRVSEAINAHADINDLLEMIESELAEMIPFDHMYIGKLDLETGSTNVLKYANPFGVDADQVVAAANRGISGEVMRTRKAILDNQAHLRSSTNYVGPEEHHYYTKTGESVMAAPLIAEDQTVGVLFLGRSGSNRFSESELETFLLFSGLVASAIHRADLVQSNQLMYRASVEVLAAVVDAKDPTTLEHSRNVARFARIIAEEMELSVSDVERIELAGLLHDIGKLSIPDHVLSKPGPLTPQERALINTHPDRGANILNQHPALMDLIPLVRHHHERFDGTGYPERLMRDEIPLGASIISVADAFDTMTSQRTYQRKRSISEALEELNRCGGTQFHPDVVCRFINAVRRTPTEQRDAVHAEKPIPQGMRVSADMS